MPATFTEADFADTKTNPQPVTFSEADFEQPAPKPSLTYKTKFNLNPLAGLSREGKMLAGALADIGQGVGDTSKAGEWENLKAATMDEPLPVEQQMKSDSPSIRIPYQAAESITQSVPQLAAAGGAGALAAKLGAKAAAIAAPIAAGAIFGTNEKGEFDPKNAAIAAALPFVGKYGGEIAGKIAQKLGTESPAVLKWLQAGGAVTAANAYLGAIQSSEIAGLPEGQKKDAILDAVASDVGQSFLGLHPDLFTKTKKPSTTGGQNAIRQQETGTVLQRQPQQVGETGGQRGRVEQGQQGQEPANAPPQPQTPQRPPSPQPETSGSDAGKISPHDLQPALLVNGKPVSFSDANEHSEIVAKLPLDAKGEYLMDANREGRHVFVDTRSGKPLTRVEATQALNKSNPELNLTEPLQSQKLNELKASTPKPGAKPVPPTEIDEQLKKSGTEGGVELTSKTDPNHKLVISPEVGTGKWRVSVLKSGEPAGHHTFDDRETAIRAALGEAGTGKIPAPGRFYPGAFEITKTSQKPPAAEDLTDSMALDENGNPIPKKKYNPAFKALGAELYEGQKYPPLKQLTDSMSVLANQSPKTDSAKTAFDFGKAVSNAGNRASSAIDGLKAVGAYFKKKFEGYPVWNTWKAALGDRHLALSESVKNAGEFVKDSEKTVPDKLTQEAISNYIDTGGNEDLLHKAEAETKDAYKEGYVKARNLSPEEKSLAENAKTYFDQRLQDAIDNGILEDGIEDYIHRIYPGESPVKSAILSELRSGIFTGRPALAKQRVYQYDYEAEKAGLKPEKSFIKRIAAYDLSLNKAIADRQAVKAMTQIKMPDGRPMVDVGGIGTKIEGTPEKAGATLIRPSAKAKNPNDPKNDRGDYKSRDYPALKKWKWVSADANGNPILVQGDVLIHPDAVKQVDPLFKRSAIREHPVGRAALAVGSTVKQTMLDLSGFHPVQITVHGWEHRTFKPVGQIDFDNPDVRGLVRGGMVVSETSGHDLFSEGLSGGGSSLTRHIPIVGEKLQAYNHWLFNDYIPRLKVATGLHALERNRARYPKLSEDELYHLTATEMNNAFGELNYEMLGRSKTMQDVMRLALLAPDFLEARAGFAGQALTKYGSEQRTALLLGAATFYVTARILNKLLDGEYHFEPKNAFSVIHNKKAYSLRTVQGDLLKLAMEPGQFIYSRLNPVYGRTLMEFFSGRDYFGRQRSALQQLQDFGSTIVPISFKGVINPREQNLFESFLNAFGITNRRNTSTDDVFQLADNFKKAHKISTEPGEFVFDPDKDPYYGIKQAAVFSDVNTTAKEIKKAEKAGHPPEAILKHFTSYSDRPFTGSKANDRVFYNELSADNKKIYDDAVKERQVMWQKFLAAWDLAGHQSASESNEVEPEKTASPLAE